MHGDGELGEEVAQVAREGRALLSPRVWAVWLTSWVIRRKATKNPSARGKQIGVQSTRPAQKSEGHAWNVHCHSGLRQWSRGSRKTGVGSLAEAALRGLGALEGDRGFLWGDRPALTCGPFRGWVATRTIT